MTRLKVHMLLDAGLPHPDIAALVAIGPRSVDRIATEEEPTAAELSADKMQSGRKPPVPDRGAHDGGG